MEQYDRINRIIRLTGMWPIDIVTKAEEVGVELPTPELDNVVHTMSAIHKQHMSRFNLSCESNKYTVEELQDRVRTMTSAVSIVSPDVERELGYSYMIRYPSTVWWASGEWRNQYVPAGEGILFRRDENVYQIPLQSLPDVPAEYKEWGWAQRKAWRNAELETIPKKTVTVICEYGSRRYAEGEPVLDQEGKVIRYRKAGEWGREMIARLKGTPSPYFFDDYTGHPSPQHSTKSKAFRQEVADACFVFMNQQ